MEYVEFIQKMIEKTKKEGCIEFKLEHHMTKKDTLKHILDLVHVEKGIFIDSLGDNEWIIYTEQQFSTWMNS